jgi:hypothetical protein
VAIAGQSYHQVVPAVSWILGRLQIETALLAGRIQRNVKDPQNSGIEGRWHVQKDDKSGAIQPVWLFQSCSSVWSVMACPVAMEVPDGDASKDLNSEQQDRENDQNDESSTDYPSMATLKTCVDNLVFRMGNLNGLDIFTYEHPPTAFGAGSPQQTEVLFQEVTRALQQQAR